jgi:hypothetical protein
MTDVKGSGYLGYLMNLFKVLVEFSSVVMPRVLLEIHVRVHTEIYHSCIGQIPYTR